jgi:hypothetical protein
MIVQFAIILLSALAHPAVSAVSIVSTDKEIKAENDGGKRTNHLREKVGPDELMGLQDGERLDESGDSPNFIPGLRALRGENDSRNWNHGSYAVASRHSGKLKLYVPRHTQVGDTLFLFLR